MRANLALLRRESLPRLCWAVVKADAYGHGLSAALEAFEKADGLALIEPGQALSLRELGWRKPILLMEGFFDEADLQACSEAGIDVVVHAPWQLELVRLTESAIQLKPRGIRLWVKFNSGMNRLGFRIKEGLHELQRLRSDGYPLGAIAHFANADAEPGDPESEQRLLDLHRAVKAIDSRIVCSFANSAASQRLLQSADPALNSLRPDLAPELGADWLRFGVALYGASAFADRQAAEFGLKVAMRLQSRVLAVQRLRADERVGYGGRFVAADDCSIAVVACGYADGYPRQAPDGTPVWIGGQLCPLAGRVSMDMLTVDVSRHPHIQAGDPVELWGQHVPVDGLAKACGTIGYQLLSGLTARVPRVIDAGQGKAAL